MTSDEGVFAIQCRTDIVKDIGHKAHRICQPENYLSASKRHLPKVVQRNQIQDLCLCSEILFHTIKFSCNLKKNSQQIKKESSYILFILTAVLHFGPSLDGYKNILRMSSWFITELFIYFKRKRFSESYPIDFISQCDVVDSRKRVNRQ